MMERKFYNELKAQKEAGIKLDWEKIGYTELINCGGARQFLMKKLRIYSAFLRAK